MVQRNEFRGPFSVAPVHLYRWKAVLFRWSGLTDLLFGMQKAPQTHTFAAPTRWWRLDVLDRCFLAWKNAFEKHTRTSSTSTTIISFMNSTIVVLSYNKMEHRLIRDGISKRSYGCYGLTRTLAWYKCNLELLVHSWSRCLWRCSPIWHCWGLKRMST